MYAIEVSYKKAIDGEYQKTHLFLILLVNISTKRSWMK